MKMSVPGRAMSAPGPVTPACCRGREPYFGKSTSPVTQTLVYENGGEPSSVDPAASLDGSELDVLPALVEPLLSRNPATLEPAAGLATNYEIDPSLTEIAFFLRGHTKFYGAPERSVAALWSNGSPVTTQDFVFAWRRLVDPANGGGNANLLSPVGHGLFFDTYSYLRKPDLGGLTLNLFGLPRLKYAWIDTNWRPS